MPDYSALGKIDADLNEILKRQTDRCVMCGLCLSHCPTYALKRRETDSPRGRIALMRALATERLPDNARLAAHLESCTLCRRCEAACPAEVPFGEMMDNARRQLFKAGQIRSRLPKWLHFFVISRTLRRLCLALTCLCRYCGLRRLLNRLEFKGLDRLRHWNAALPSETPLLKYSKSTAAQHSSATARSVTLFTGCIAEMIDSETLIAASNLLQSAGFEVQIPDTQGCCGALHQHRGDMPCANALILQNAMAFGEAKVVISCATGCGIQLHEHQKRLGIEHFDLIRFLAARAERLNFNRLSGTLAQQRIALHFPCTARGESRGESRNESDAFPALKRLLAKIDGLQYETLPDALLCCGAAGTYMLDHREAADALASKYLDILEAQEIDMLMTLNIGCAVHFRRAAAARRSRHGGRPLEVMHPAVLLSRQLSNGNRTD